MTTSATTYEPSHDADPAWGHRPPDGRGPASCAGCSWPRW